MIPTMILQLWHSATVSILTCEVAAIPNMSVCRKIDLKLRRQANDYIAIYTTPQSEHHLWACPLKLNEKRDMVIVEYATADQADFLFSKLAAITFNIDELTTIIDVRQHVTQALPLIQRKLLKISITDSVSNIRSLPLSSQVLTTTYLYMTVRRKSLTAINYGMLR